MSRKRKKIGAIFMVLAMICTMIWPTASAKANDSIIVTLDDGAYGDSYISSYGTVQYSIDNGENWKAIDVDTQGVGESDHAYMINATSITIKVTKSMTCTQEYQIIQGQTTLTPSEAGDVIVTDNVNIDFLDDSGDGGSDDRGNEQGITISLDNGKYDDAYKINYGSIEYSTNYDLNDTSSTTWNDLSNATYEFSSFEDQGTTFANHNYTLSSNTGYVWIKVTLATGKESYTISIPDLGNATLTSGVAKELTQGCHLSISTGANDPGGDSGDSGNNPGEPVNSPTVELRGLSGTDGHTASISQDGTNIGTVNCSLGDITTLSNGDCFEYQNVNIGNTFTITIMPEEGYSPEITYTNKGITYNTDAQICKKNEDGSYTFSFSLTSENNGCLTFVINCVKRVEASIDIQIGGQTYHRVGNGSIVKGNFDINNLDLVITRIYQSEEDTEGTSLTDCKTVGFTPDSQGRNPLELFTTQVGTNCITVNIENHEGGDSNNPLFYFTNITFANENANFVSVDSGIETFLFQDTVATDKAELSSSIETPTEFTFYYGSDSVTFNSPEGEQQIKSIELAEDIAAGAVTVDGKKVTFHSPYYNSVVLKVTLGDGTIGYVQINRIGISIDGYQFINGENTAWHGSQSGPDLSNANNINKYNVVASFYFDGTTGATGSNYDLISIATFADGHTETSVVEATATDGGSPYGEVQVADYIVWTGAKADAPVQVAVTAVKHGATSSASNFGGAAFGAGMGVVKKIDKN